jgi:glutathione S-transferase
MTYHLYNRVGSGGFVAEAALALAGAPYELLELGSEPGTPLPESFRDINPWGQVPALVLPDGSVMTETAAILIHLAACYPAEGFAPAAGTPAHAAFLRWIIFTNVNIYEATLRQSYPFRYTSDPNAHDATRDAAIARMGEALAVLEKAIDTGPFLLGETMNLADIYIAMLFVWFSGEIDVPNLTRLTDGVRRHPTVAPIWRRHFGGR